MMEYMVESCGIIGKSYHMFFTIIFAGNVVFCNIYVIAILII